MVGSFGSKKLRAQWYMRVLKIQAGGEATGVVQTKRLVALETHWANRVVVCPGEGCELCRLRPVRTLGYGIIALGIGGSPRAFLLELPAGAAVRLRDSLPLFEAPSEDLRGFEVQISRRTRKSPVQLVVLRTGGVVIPEFGDETRLGNAIACLYGLPLLLTGETVEDWGLRVKEDALSRTRQFATVIAGRS